MKRRPYKAPRVVSEKPPHIDPTPTDDRNAVYVDDYVFESGCTWAARGMWCDCLKCVQARQRRQ